MLMRQVYSLHLGWDTTVCRLDNGNTGGLVPYHNSLYLVVTSSQPCANIQNFEGQRNYIRSHFDHFSGKPAMM